MPGYRWYVLPAADLARVTYIDVDGKRLVERIGDALLDLTAYRAIEGRLLSARQSNDNPLWWRVDRVREWLRVQHPDMDDGEIAEREGVPKELLAYADAFCESGNAGEFEDPEGEGPGGGEEAGPLSKAAYLARVMDAGRAHLDRVHALVAFRHGYANHDFGDFRDLVVDQWGDGVDVHWLRLAWDDASRILDEPDMWVDPVGFRPPVGEEPGDPAVTEEDF